MRVAIRACDIFVVSRHNLGCQIYTAKDVYNTSTSVEEIWHQLIQPFNVCWIRVGQFIFAYDRIQELIEDGKYYTTVHICDRAFNAPGTLGQALARIEAIEEDQC